MGGHEFVDLGGGDGIDFLEEGVVAAQCATMEVLLRHVDGEVLAVLGGESELAFQLALLCIEGGSGERCLAESLQFAVHQTDAALAVGLVTTEVDAPKDAVGVGGHEAFDAIHQTALLAQGDVQTGVHGRSAEHAVDDEERHAPAVEVGGDDGALDVVRLVVFLW